MEISVIIPVYNCESYLERCLGSVLGQTFSDFELICVDDRSTDASLGILRRFASMDSRVKLIEAEEKVFDCGARNIGLDAASGEWLYFMDSDDWLDPDSLAQMLSRAEGADEPVVVNANYVEEWEDSPKRAFSSDFGFIVQDGYYPSRTVQSKFPPVVWARLYRRAFIRDNNIRFVPVLCSSDVAFTGITTLLSERSYVFRGPFYHYYQRRTSIMKSADRGFTDMSSFNYLYDDIRARGLSADGPKLFYIGPTMMDSKKFDLFKSFFSKAGEDIMRHPELYAPHDLFVMKAVTQSPDLGSYLRQFGPNTMVAFIRNKARSNE